MSELTHDDVKKILSIIDSMDGNCSATLEFGDVKLQITRGNAQAQQAAPAAFVPPAPAASQPAPAPAQPVPQSPAAPARPMQAAAAPKAPAQVPEGMVAVVAPSSGTFYRAPSPNDKPFVEVGHHVEATDTVAIFDVMKLFMSLTAGVKGTVAAILVDNQTVAEKGQPLILVKPD